MKKIALGDLGEFVYRDYKEPFEPLEGGYPGHPKGALLVDEPTGKLLCAYCGKTYELLGRHVAAMHNLSASEYRREVGLRGDTALASDRVRVANLKQALARNSAAALTNWGRRHRRQVAHHIRQVNRREQGPASGRGPWNPEYLNKHGRCYTQVLTIARQLAAAGRLTRPQLQRAGIGPKTVAGWFGSYEELRRRVGAPPPSARNHGLSDDDLINGLRAIAGQIGRTPYHTDLRRFGLPAPNTYTRRFGSWSRACQLAGLIPNPSAGIEPSVEQEIELLTAYAVTGAYLPIIRRMHHDDKWARQVFAKYGWPFPPGYRGPGRREWAADMARRLSGIAEAA